MDFYRQCILKSDNLQTTAWIEERGATEGFSVTLEDSGDPGRWWKVVSVGGTRLPKTVALDRARDAVNFKKGSSIADQ